MRYVKFLAHNRKLYVIYCYFYSIAYQKAHCHICLIALLSFASFGGIDGGDVVRSKKMWPTQISAIDFLH